MAKLAVAWLTCLFLAGAAVAQNTRGGVEIIPSNPTGSSNVTLRVVHRFGSLAGLNSYSITRTGDSFTIQHNVHSSCAVFADTPVGRDYEVGQLSPGTYQVVVNIAFEHGGFPCGWQPITETSTFFVQDASAIPALDWRTLIVLATVLGFVGVFVMRR